MYLKNGKNGSSSRQSIRNTVFFITFSKKNWVGREMGKVKHFMGMSSNRMKHTNAGKEYYHELYLGV